MKKFSDRIGLTSSISEIQVNSMNIELRNTIWNFMHLLIGEPTFHSENWQKITKIFYTSGIKFIFKDVLLFEIVKYIIIFFVFVLRIKSFLS